ncbi:MAG: pro-sigmaK processing inhibitor BofA family protein [Eubacteriales bacterium]|nr:pro-sigmaK processing inhibitor BofA family protein [Eubacteriales bacterium]
MKVLRFFLKLLVRAAMGAVFLILVNLIGGLFDFHVSLNLASSVTTGLLGIPGVLLLTILRFLFP